MKAKEGNRSIKQKSAKPGINLGGWLFMNFRGEEIKEKNTGHSGSSINKSKDVGYIIK